MQIRDYWKQYYTQYTTTGGDGENYIATFEGVPIPNIFAALAILSLILFNRSSNLNISDITQSTINSSVDAHVDNNIALINEDIQKIVNSFTVSQQAQFYR